MDKSHQKVQFQVDIDSSIKENRKYINKQLDLLPEIELTPLLPEEEVKDESNVVFNEEEYENLEFS